jgi:hypothetical protein
MEESYKEQELARDQRLTKLKQEIDDQMKDIKMEIRIMKFARTCFEKVIMKEKLAAPMRFHVPIDIPLQMYKEIIEKHLNIFGLSWDGTMVRGWTGVIDLKYIGK